MGKGIARCQITAKQNYAARDGESWEWDYEVTVNQRTAWDAIAAITQGIHGGFITLVLALLEAEKMKMDDQDISDETEAADARVRLIQAANDYNKAWSG